jgi:gliding motility-associated-like protein
MICNENCTNYELPNVFTPNGDDINDTFRPKDCPRFVESVTLRVVNRWGKEVYSFTSSGDISIFINWDGKTNDGQELPTGVYYYVAEVKFTMRDPSRAHQTFKGWVQILR